MGKYIVQSDVEDVFGLDNICLWSNLNNDTTAADTTRIGRAIAYAEGYVEDRFRGGKYQVPFAGTVPTVMKDWMANLAGVWLFESRPKVIDEEEISFDENRERIEREMGAYLSGQRRFGGLRMVGQSEMPEGPIVL